MNIILEGCDATGKSTLAERIAQRLKWPLVESGGPSEEAVIRERANRFLEMDRVVFARHVCVSEFIYGAHRGYVMLPDSYPSLLYSQYNLFIYCCVPGLPHVTKKRHGDNERHLAMIEEREHKIKRQYDLWAIQHADLIYRDTKQANVIINLCEAWSKL